MDKCFECGEPAQANHHVVPKILGGTKTIPLCDDCHSKVHDKDLTSMRKLTTDLFKSWGPPKVGRRHKGGIPPYGFVERCWLAEGKDYERAKRKEDSN